MNRQFPLLAVPVGAAAFFLRLWQNHSGFEADTGLPVPGAAGRILPLFLLAAAVLFLVLARRFPREEEGTAVLPRDFSAENPRLLMLPVAGALLMAVAGLADLYEGFGLGNPLAQFLSAADPYGSAAVEPSAFSPGAQKLLGVLSLLSAGALLPAISACRQSVHGEEEFRAAPLLLIPPVALVIRLVLVYRLDSVNPVLEAYYVELLALVFLTLGFYRLSAFAFGAGQTRTFAVYGTLAVVLCLTALADGGPCLSSLLLYVGGGAALLGFLMLRLHVPAVDSGREDPDLPAS